MTIPHGREEGSSAMYTSDVVVRHELRLTKGSHNWNAPRVVAMLLPSREEGWDVQFWDGPEPLWRLPAHEVASPAWVACPASLEVGIHRGCWVTLSQADRREVCSWVRDALGDLGARLWAWPCEANGNALRPICSRAATGSSRAMTVSWQSVREPTRIHG